MSPACNYRAYSNWSLATYPFFSSSKIASKEKIAKMGICRGSFRGPETNVGWLVTSNIFQKKGEWCFGCAYNRRNTVYVFKVLPWVIYNFPFSLQQGCFAEYINNGLLILNNLGQ